ncbi:MULTISPECIES: capsular biosynthesis protein [unclassified Rhizobium]|uniref:ABC transporter permease n=1 Tax=unclassified Rhizobium TaxID=2613769 RepID=UPI001FDEC1EF|nr:MULTISPECIES: capsular biosynthesis protein [unclassified Rhizobium]
MPARPPTKRSPMRLAFQQKINVMNAVMLRDMRARFFNHGAGFLVQSLWPLVHMLVIMILNTIAGRSAPYGDNPMLFFATGVLPVLTFIYVSRFMSLSLLMNQPMLSFPVVKITDVLFARAILEVLAGCITLAMMAGIFIALRVAPYPIDPPQAVLAYLATILLAVGVGTLAGVITMFLPIFATAFALLGLVFYLSSGALFVTSAFPDPIAIPMSYNPLVQSVEWMRTAYFETYSDRLVDKEYLVGFGMISLLCGLLLERVARRRMLEV